MIKLSNAVFKIVVPMSLSKHKNVFQITDKLCMQVVNDRHYSVPFRLEEAKNGVGVQTDQYCLPQLSELCVRIDGVARVLKSKTLGECVCEREKRTTTEERDRQGEVVVKAWSKLSIDFTHALHLLVQQQQAYVQQTRMGKGKSKETAMLSTQPMQVGRPRDTPPPL